LFVEGALEGEFFAIDELAGGEEKREGADAVEVAVVAFVAEPVEEGAGVALGGAGPEFFLPAGGGFEQRGGDAEGMLEAGAEVAAVDADDDAELLTGRIFLEKRGEMAAEPVEIVEVVPFDEALDVGVESAAEEGHEAEFVRAFGGVQLMEGLKPEQGELDGVLAFMRFRREIARGIGIGREGIDEIGRADGASERGEVIAPIEVPLEVRAVADAEDEVGVGERRVEERPERGGVGAEADAKIDVRGDDAGQGTVFGRGRQRAGRGGGEGFAEKREGFDGTGGVAIGMMPGGERSGHVGFK